MEAQTQERAGEDAAFAEAVRAQAIAIARLIDEQRYAEAHDAAKTLAESAMRQKHQSTPQENTNEPSQVQSQHAPPNIGNDADKELFDGRDKGEDVGPVG